MKINKEWLNSQLKMLRVDAGGSMADKIVLFHERIEKIFAFKLFHSQWTLTEFLTLAIAFRITEELRKPGVYWCELRDWVPITLLFHNDVIAITRRFHHYYYEKLIFLTMLHQSKGISSHAPAIDWLELVESAKADLYINKEMICYKIVDGNAPHIIEDIIPGGMLNLVSSQAAKLIRYSTFELSEHEECASNEYFPIVYTLQKLAERWQTNEKNIIAACLRSSAFGAYLCIDDDMQICEGTIPIHAATINQQLLSGKLDTDYKYPLKGYVRLAKKHDLPCGITLSYFYTKKMIEQTDVNSIYIEVPLCKYVLGIYQYIKISQDLEPTLFFNAEEIHKFEQTSSFINLFPQMVFSGLETAIATRDEEKMSVSRNALIEQCTYKIIFDLANHT